jgi:hypothetical protein
VKAVSLAQMILFLLVVNAILLGSHVMELKQRETLAQLKDTKVERD